jgi:hypothetical protein
VKKIPFSFLISLGLLLCIPLNATANTESTKAAEPLIEIDQVLHTATAISASRKATTFQVITGKIHRRLDPGEYKFTNIPPCIMENGNCKLFPDGYYHPIEERRYSSLAPWGSPNKAVELMMYFDIVKLYGSAKRVKPAIDGYNVQTGFHSPIISKLKNGKYTPFSKIEKGYDGSEGCVRTDQIYSVYTFVIDSYNAGIPAKIIVKR